MGAGQVCDEEGVDLGDAVYSSLNGHIKVNGLYLEDVSWGPMMAWRPVSRCYHLEELTLERCSCVSTILLESVRVQREVPR